VFVVLSKNDAMVSYSTIIEIAKKSNTSVNGENAILASECYDAGMAEILKEIAENLLFTDTDIMASKSSVKAGIKVDEAKKALLCSLGSNSHELVKDFEESFQDLMGIEVGDWFVEGFVRGYRYLKHSIAHKIERED
jgi:hypothetical protein